MASWAFRSAGLRQVSRAVVDAMLLGSLSFVLIAERLLLRYQALVGGDWAA